MGTFVGYQCSLCHTQYAPDEVTYTCPKDGGNLDVLLDTELIRRHTAIKDILANPEMSLWRYLPLLPVADPGGQGTPLRVAGGAPGFNPARLGGRIWAPHPRGGGGR